jgi:hypothetical protein
MMKRSLAVAAAGVLMMLTPGQVQSQTPGMDGMVRGPIQTILPQRLAPGSVRVQSALSFFVPGPTGEGGEAQKLRDRVKASLYENAAHECDLLKATLANDCRLESVNVNINSNRQIGSQQEGFNVNGSTVLHITLK